MKFVNYHTFLLIRLYQNNLVSLIILVSFIFIGHVIRAQNIDYEQAYGFAYKDKSVFNKALPFNGSGLLAVGQYNGRGVIASLAGNGETIAWQSYDSLLNGHESNFTTIVFNELSSIAAGKPFFTIAGLCKDCIPNRKGQSVVIFRIGVDLKPMMTNGKLFTFIAPTVDTFQALSNVEALVSGYDLYVAYDGNSGFGSDIYMNKLDERTHSKLWDKQFNTNFFEVPLLLTNESPFIIGLALHGWGKNRILKINPGNGAIMNQYDFNDIPGRFTYLYNGRYALAYTQDKSIQVRFIDSLGRISDSTRINQYSGYGQQFAIGTFPFGQAKDASIGIVCHALDSTLLPYYHVKTSMYRITPGSIKPVYTAGITHDNNGTINRNITQLIPHGSTQYSIIGERLEDNSTRAFMINSTTITTAPTPPVLWYSSDYCIDSTLIIKTASKTFPHTLPHILNNVLYDTKINFANKPEQLWMDIYQPYDHYAKGSTDKRPLLIYVAGGGYIASTEDLSNFALQATQRGMIAASIRYRVGIHPSFNGSLYSLVSYASFAQKAVYRALQDLRSAVKFLSAHAKEYNIDTSKIFISEHSAGGNAVLNYAFLSEKDFPAAFVTEMGTLTAKTPIAGVIAYEAPFSTTASFPVDPLTTIDANEKEPIYFIHGTCDDAAFFNTGNPFDLTSQYTIGAFPIACKKQLLKQPYHLTTIKGGNHSMGAEEPLVMNSVFNWIKKKVACGTPNQECEIYTVPNSNPCATVAACPSCLVNAISDNGNIQFKIFPNPAHNTLNIESISNHFIKYPLNIRILNALGQSQRMSSIIPSNRILSQPIDISTLSQGVYVLTIEQDYQIIESKSFIKW